MAPVLVTGATGYLGGRLVPELLEAGHTVRCLARTPGKLDGEPWRSAVAVVGGDVTDPPSLDAALGGMDAVWLAAGAGAEAVPPAPAPGGAAP